MTLVEEWAHEEGASIRGPLYMSQSCFHMALLMTFHLGLSIYHVLLPLGNYLNNLSTERTLILEIMLKGSYHPSINLFSCYASAHSKVIRQWGQT